MPEEVLIEQASDGASTSGGATLTAATDHTLAAENHERDKLIVTADTADVWLSYGTAAAVVGQGIRVKAGSEPFVEGGWKGEVHCISSGAAVVGVIETSFHAGDDEGERQPGADTFVPSGPSDSYSSGATSAAEADPNSTAKGGSSGQPYPVQPT